MTKQDGVHPSVSQLEKFMKDFETSSHKGVVYEIRRKRIIVHKGNKTDVTKLPHSGELWVNDFSVWYVQANQWQVYCPARRRYIMSTVPVRLLKFIKMLELMKL